MAAKKQEPKKEAAAATEAAAPNNKKLFIIFGAALVVAIGASVGGTLFLLGGKDEEPEEPEVVEEPKVAAYHVFEPPFVINYQVAGRGRYLQTELSVFTHKATVIDAVKQHEPLVKARISETLAAQNFLDLQTTEGKKSLQKVLLETVNGVLKKNQVEDEVEQVMFGSFVLQ